MFTDNSKGGYVRPVRKQEKVNILLIGSQASDADEIKRELGLITGLACSAWYCSNPTEAVDFIRKGDFHIDVIFLDLSLFNSDYPKEYFLQIKQNISDIPIIVLTDRTDYDLQHFVMEEGAAENISQWQLRGDPDRLRNIVESCCSRDKISKKEHQESAADLKAAYAQGESDVLREHERGDAAMKKASENYASELQNAVDENARLSRDNDKGVADLKESRERRDADVLEAHQWGDAALRKNRDKYTADLRNVHDEMAQLRLDKSRSDVDLKEFIEQGKSDLQQAHDKSDAILKYAQDKGAIDMKKVVDENKELHKELDQAKEWLSGGYSSNH